MVGAAVVAVFASRNPDDVGDWLFVIAAYAIVLGFVAVGAFVVARLVLAARDRRRDSHSR